MIHMSKKGIIAGLLLIALLILANVALAETAEVTASSLYLRKEATSDSEALLLLRQGKRVEILGKSGRWYKVVYGKYTGYVYDEYVSVSKDGTLLKGDNGPSVKAVQERLKELGYYNNTCDGSFGNVTVNAVKAFQKKNGLTQDGKVTEATLKKLNASSAIPANGKAVVTEEKKEETKDDGTLKKGSTGSEVKKLQQRLKDLGYYKSSCDGNFGNVTVNALKAFQKKNGLTQDGVAGTETLKKLNSTSAIAANGNTESETEKEETKVDDTLKKGDRGSEVKKLQQRLKELGYYTYSIDSSYGDRTVEAVKAFQKRNSLSVDGICGTATLRKLNSTSAVKASTTPVKEEEKAEQKEETKDDGTLKKGSKGEAVKKVQQRLKELGFYSSSCDGDFGDRTVTAVKEFQKKNSLTQNGQVNEATLKKLNSENAVNAKGTTIVDLNTSQTLKQGDSGAQVKSLQNELKKLGYYTNSLDSDYGYRTVAAVSEFQRANKLTVNGVANPATLRKLVSSSAISKSEADKKAEESKTYKTEKLDWFKNGYKTFPKRAIIEIKDVRTGLVFKAQVLYGTNHLDVEPLTKADTAILLKINGGVDFSWRRRPMLVKYNDHVYAASIYSEPHGDQTIYNNNFDGQFCLHFYGSKTHGTGEVKADHQACIAEAMKATW